MSFRLRSDADDYFRHIAATDGPIRTKFDQYYLSLMIGLTTGRNERAASAPEFVTYFVADYAPIGRLLVGLLVVVEAARLGVELTEKGDVKKLLSDYLDPTNPTSLSEAGFQKLNDYANGGYSALVEAIPQKPHHVEDFLQAYTSLIGTAVSQSKTWRRYSHLAT
jgi:hypothetical protein